MKLVDRYILDQFGRIFFLSTVILIFIYEIVLFLEELSVFSRHNAEFSDITWYLFCKIPLALYHVTPIGVLIGIIVTMSSLSRNGELTSILMSGMSLFRASWILLIASFLISLFLLIGNETIGYKAEREANKLYLNDIKKSSRSKVYSEKGFWIQKDDGSIWNIGYFNDAQNIIDRIRIYNFNSNNSRIKESITLLSGTKQGSQWQFEKLIKRSFTESTPFIEEQSSNVSFHQDFIDSDSFKQILLSPEEMSIGELSSHIRNIESKGYQSREQQVEKHVKISFPFLTFILALIAIPLGIQSERVGGSMVGVAISLVCVVIVWLSFSFAISLGKSAIISPQLSGYIVHTIFGLAGAILLWRKSEMV
ncbi:MAG: LptF/LptG family permease [Nitrospinota bacterium]